MTPYPYQLTIKGRTISGNLYSETGTYVGGRQRNSGQKGASESIEVRTADGKVQTLHLDYIIDPPITAPSPYCISCIMNAITCFKSTFTRPIAFMVLVETGWIT